MKFEDAQFSREQRYSLGIETDSGRCYLSIPVSNGLVDYEEYYELSEEQYRLFLVDPVTAAQFAESCRRREQDDRLIQRPGSNRGTPV
jgi:hypothetical protein